MEDLQAMAEASDKIASGAAARAGVTNTGTDTAAGEV